MKKNFLWIVVLIILVIPSLWSLVRPGFFPMQDDLQAFRIHQMDKCFQDFQLPCRWVPDPGYQYGYPQFLFYPPSVYYLGEVFHLIGFQFIDSVKILFVLGFVLSAITMFILLKAIFGTWPALIGALLYSYVPYKAVEVYVRGAMSEFWTLLIFPLIFWAIYQLIRTGKTKYISWMAVSIGLLLLTHNLMSLLFLPIAAVWGLGWALVEKKIKYILPKLIVGALLGLGLAAFFTLPVLFEQQYVHIESLRGGYFDYRQHFVDIKQLFFTNNWGYGSSYLGPGDDLSLSTGPIHALLGIFAILFALFQFKQKPKIAVIICLIGVVELGVLFMIHQKSSFIWEQLQFLAIVQFPWRLLGVSIFLLSFLVAAFIFLIKNQKLSILGGVIAVGSVLFLHLSFFQPREWFDLTDQQKFSGQLWEKQLTISIFDYLPIYSKFPPIQKAPDFPEVLEGQASFSSYNKRSNYQYGQVEVQERALLRLPIFDFPGMLVLLNDQKISHKNNDCRGQEFCLGLVTVDVPEGNHNLLVKLTDTKIRTIGNILSIISFCLVVILFTPFKKIFKLK